MTSPRIGYAGMTHLGINSAAAAAARGFATLCYDESADVIAKLEAGELPVVEPDLPELVAANRERLTFSANAASLKDCDVVYIAADVPTDDNGISELSGIRALTERVAAHLAPHAILVVLCQVPPGFTRDLSWPADQRYYQVETLVFGRAVERAMHPERFIVGCADPSKPLPPAYAQYLAAFECPILPMRYESAELGKIAINCCLVASVTVANTLAELSERIGADWNEIVPALKLDKRIGAYSYLSPGLGISGGNLERDLATVLHLSTETGSNAGLIRAFRENSAHRKDWLLRTIHGEILARKPDATVGVLGLAYKENTHSTKNSPSLAALKHLHHVNVRLFDPVVPASAAEHPRATACKSAIEAATGADALIIPTAWPEFREIQAADLARVMKGRIVVDPFRMLDGRALVEAGFIYATLGTATVEGAPRA